MNQWNGIVRITNDIEVKHLAGTGTTVCSFTGAVDKFNAKKLKEEGKPSANFIRFKCFGKRGEVISQYFSKGDMIGLSGSIETGSYENAEGVKVYTTEVLVSDLTFIPKSNKTEKQQNQQSTGWSKDDDFSFGTGSFEDFQNIEDDDDVPF